MQVCHLSLTPLVHAPIRIVNSLNKYSNTKNYLFISSADRGMNDIVLAKEKLASADIIHCHHPVFCNELDVINNLLPFNIQNYVKKNVKIVYQFHSNPSLYSKNMNTELIKHAQDINYYNKDIAFISIFHYYNTFYFNSYCCPNILDIYNELYQPQATNNLIPKLIGSSYYTSNSGAFINRYDNKCIKEINKVLHKLKQQKLITYELLSGMEHSELINRKKQANILFDELSTGNFHLTALESLSLGKPTFSYVDNINTLQLGTVLGSTYNPFINVSFENLEVTLRELIKNPQAMEEIGVLSRQWVEQFYNPKILVKNFVHVYEKLLNEEHQINNNNRKYYPQGLLFLNNKVSDIHYEARKQQFMYKKKWRKIRQISYITLVVVTTIVLAISLYFKMK